MVEDRGGLCARSGRRLKIRHLQCNKSKVFHMKWKARANLHGCLNLGTGKGYPYQ